MRKIIFSIPACLTLLNCFSQNTIVKDSNRIATATFRGAAAQPELTTKPSVNIYPNPAKNKITLQVRGFWPGIAVVKLIDIKGKLIREDSRLLTNGNEDVIMFLMLPPGIYFIMLIEKERMVKKKLVIQ